MEPDMDVRHCEAGPDHCQHCSAEHKERTADDLVGALRLFDMNFLLIGNIPVGEFVLAIRRLQIECDRLNNLLSDIGDMAHDASTGPAVPDVLWEIRSKAYQE
jgi:hypothetical protein